MFIHEIQSIIRTNWEYLCI